MTGFTVRDLLLAVNGKPSYPDGLDRRIVKSVSTDTRSQKRGGVFIALRGGSFDGHDFIDAAYENGALLCVVSRSWHTKHGSRLPGRPAIVVEDTTRALGDAARAYRSAFSLPVILVTGSNGKTTTKEQIAVVLKTKYGALQTEGNLNNHIGLPATLFGLNASHEAVVLEAGSNQPGDIAYLCSIARHTHAVITNVGRSHLERLKSREGVAREKAAAFETLPAGGTAFFNRDDDLLQAIAGGRRNRISFGTARGSTARIAGIRLDAMGRPSFTLLAPSMMADPVNVSLRQCGRHAVYGAAAAFVVGLHFGCRPDDMKATLESFRGYGLRMQALTVGGVIVINDAYNANPDSVLAAVETLARMRTAGRKILVLGDMLELGRSAAEEHDAAGERIAELGIPYVLTFGRFSRRVALAASGTAVHAQHYTDKALLFRAVDALAQEGDTVLVKGSRGMAMDEVVDHLRSKRGHRE